MSGDQVVDKPRPRNADDLSVNHGGVAIVAGQGIRLSPVTVAVDAPSTFEYTAARTVDGSFAATIVVVYRPGSQAVQSSFYDEFASMMEVIAVRQERVFIVGDINIRFDRANDPDTVRFLDMIASYGFQLQSTPETHLQGGILDVVITQLELAPISTVSVIDVGLSDHHLLSWEVRTVRTTIPPERVTRRPWRLLDIEALRSAITTSTLCQPEQWPADVDNFAELYDTELTVILDGLIPARPVVRRKRASDVWYDRHCREAKRATRRLERAYASASRRCNGRVLPSSADDAAAGLTAATVDAVYASKVAWYEQRRRYRELLLSKRRDYWARVFEANRESPKRLWRTIDQLLGRGRPPVCSDVTAEDLSDYFVRKVADVRSTTASAPHPAFRPMRSSTSFSGFRPVSIDDVVSAVRLLPNKSSEVDPLPVDILKQVIGELAPYFRELFNRSLTAGHFPETFKSAYITPLLKKPGLDATDVRSYRPISNLSIVSKLLERLVSRQLTDYLRIADLLPTFQSAYRPHHSTETAVLHVLSEILTSIDRGDISALVLLDLSAAFDTVDHGILLKRLKSSFGIVGSAYSWFQSYLSGRSQYVRLGSVRSSVIQLVCGIPQGSVLGPILFLLYTADLVNLVEKHGLKVHLYADDSQVYGFCPSNATDALQERLSMCLDDVARWMESNRLQLNTDKTELLWCATARRQDQLPSAPLRTGTCSVYRASSVRDLGIFIDANLTMQTHVRKTVSACFAVLRQLTGIRRSVPVDTYKSLIISLVISRLDYGNATLYGLPNYLYNTMQSVLNAAARSVFRLRRFDHVTPALIDLHWLRVPERVRFKVATLVYRCLHGLAPQYLTASLHRTVEVDSRRRLRSADSELLIVPRSRLVTMGDRSFSVAGPRIWNSLPLTIRSTQSLASFKRQLKTFLFSSSFCN